MTKKKSKSVTIHPTAIVEDGVEIGKNVSIWHFVHVRKEAVLGNEVSLGRDVYIDRGVKIGQGTRVQNGVSVYAGVHVGDWCFIGPHVIFTNDFTPRVGTKSWEISNTFIETGASLGAGTIVICGKTVGAFSLIGAGSVVTSSIPAFHLAMGNPIRVKKMVCACGRTFLPIGSNPQELVRDCCRVNLDIKILNAAKGLLKYPKIPKDV
jgi:UDP-2-acetamido-3-amino-2,3-dideoxy-glucuronate N-acetyltransferase